MPVQVTSNSDKAENIAVSLTGTIDAPPEKDTTPALDADASSETVVDSGSAKNDEAKSDTLDAGSDNDLAANESDVSDNGAKKKGGFQKRIDKLSKRVSQAEQEREYWRQVALGSKPQATAGAVESKPLVVENKKPIAMQFESIEAYTEAMAEWKLDQKLAVRDQNRKLDEIKAREQSLANSHLSKVEKFKEDHDDWDDIMDDIRSVPVSIAVRDAVWSAEDSAGLFYELAKNPKELARLSQMDPIQAAKEIGKLEAKLSASSELPVSKTPPPVNPVKGRASGQSKSIYDTSISIKDYEKQRMEQIKRRRAGL